MRSKVTRSCLPTNDVPNQYVRAVKNNGVSVGISDTVGKKLLELGPVFFGATVDCGRRRHPLEDAVAVICRIITTE